MQSFPAASGSPKSPKSFTSASRPATPIAVPLSPKQVKSLLATTNVELLALADVFEAFIAAFPLYGGLLGAIKV